MNFIPKIKYVDHSTGLPKEIIFNSPPEGDPINEGYKHKLTKTIASDGTEQVQYNYGQLNYSLEFLFQSEVVKNLVVDFFNNHAIRGAKFDYYASNDEIEFITFQIDQKIIDFERPIPSAIVGEYEYNFKLKFKKVL